MVAPVGVNLSITRKQVQDALREETPQGTIRAFELLFRSQNGASPNYGWRLVDADGGIEDGDYLVRIDAMVAPVEITLPAATQAEGRQLVFKLIDASGNGVTLTPDGTDLIDGAASLAWTTQWTANSLLSDGTNWNIVATVP